MEPLDAGAPLESTTPFDAEAPPQPSVSADAAQDPAAMVPSEDSNFAHAEEIELDPSLYDEYPPEPQRRRGGRWAWLLVFLVLVLGAGGAAGYYVIEERKKAAYEEWRWAKIGMDDALARVPEEWDVETLVARLEGSGKVRHPDTFLEAANEMGLSGARPGGYALPPVAGPRDLVAIFAAGPTHRQVTFPEGFTGLQIAARLQSNGFPGGDEIEDLVYPAQGFSPYEGTLFPDTYWLPIRANGKTLIAQMQDNFKRVVEELPRPFPEVKGQELSTREIVILASLIEREAASRDEMPEVAGVLINRLRLPMRLQVDASIQYARVLTNAGHKAQLLYRDLRIDSPFNTYQHDGLPPAPICNPGKAALEAAARPAETEAFYYVYSPALRKHRFARTYSEHLTNVRQGRRERDAAARASSG